MAATPLNEYLVYLPGRDGRQVYIDPSLVPVFTECVNPTNDAGRKIANDIQHKLSSEATGTKSGQAIGDAAEFYMDIGNVGDSCVRVFYQVLQAGNAEANKGPGVYIHNIHSISSNGRGVDVGLFHMRANGLKWSDEKVTSHELTSKVLRLGSVGDKGGLIELSELSKEMLKASAQESDKTDFNLYHCPLTISSDGNNYATPEARHRVVSPSELADVLVNTASLDEWSGRHYENYTVYCYNDASKLLESTLSIVKSKNISLEKFTFSLVAPYSPFSFIKKLADDCSATATLEAGFISDISKLHQNFDPASLKQDAMSTCQKYSDLLENDSIESFFDLWKGMGSKAQIPNLG